MDWTALLLSFELAACTTLVVLVVAVPLAHWIATTRSRLQPLVETLVGIPLVLPPTVLGFFLLLALGPRGPLGDLSLAFTFPGLVVASTVYALPFAVQPLAAAFGRVDRRLVEASWTLGASPARTFFAVVLPLARHGVLAAALLAFAHVVGEFGVVLMVGGNVAGRTRTASLAIYDSVQALDYATATRTSLALLAFAAAVLTATSWLGRRRP
jgi:molybdate transport system permease protein